MDEVTALDPSGAPVCDSYALIYPGLQAAAELIPLAAPPTKAGKRGGGGGRGGGKAKRGGGGGGRANRVGEAESDPSEAEHALEASAAAGGGEGGGAPATGKRGRDDAEVPAPVVTERPGRRRVVAPARAGMVVFDRTTKIGHAAPARSAAGPSPRRRAAEVAGQI